MLPAHSVAQEAAEGRLRFWRFEPPLLRTVHLVVPTDRPVSHAAGAVDGLCRTVPAELVRSGTWSSACHGLNVLATLAPAPKAAL